MNPELVIFDCDGVLVDSEAISSAVLAEILSAAGLPTTAAQARRDFEGLLLADVAARAERRLGRPLPAGWMDRFERQRATTFRRELRPVPGAVEAITRVTGAGIQVCVAPQGKLSKTRLSLELAGLDRLFPERVRFSAEAVARGKPAPDLFLHAAASMGVDPASCAVVEDTAIGIAAAVSARMPAFGYCAAGDGQALRDAGARVFGSLLELPGLLGAG